MLNLSISLLGSFQASINEKSISQFRTKSVQALLIYLVCEAKRPSSREQLMDLLWPGLPLASAQSNMRQTLYRLRKLIPEVHGNDGGVVPFLITNRKTIQINPDAKYFADVQAFSDLLDHEPEKAIELYRGNFLVDFYLPDSETFEEWANNQRELYRRQVLEAMEKVTVVSIQNSIYDKAIQLAQRQLAIDNLRESSHRQLMEAHARNGRRQDAIAHYDNLRRLLQNELAIEPEAETLTLIEAIRAGEFSRTTSIPRTNEPALPKHNLPQRLSLFIGREKEMTEIRDLITQHRLVMLTGVGGIGKTNLSLQVGRTLIETFPDGVWLVELAPTADPDLVPQTIATALGLQDSTARPIQESLLEYLREQQCLLILDNCEHLINGVAQFVQTVLQQCADVKILASSREALAVPGERPFSVPPLTLPENESILEEWPQYEATRLFVERAQIVLPEFQVTADNMASLVQICQRLDGIPLALELAAARVKVLTTSQIAERLDDRFRLLTGGSRAALPRQQTLRALIDWSWELLTENEQHLLQRLSVFAGGMDLEAIEAICADESLQSYEIFDALNELVNKSLVNVQRKQGEETRYYLLETIHQYAQERFIVTREVDTYRQNHLAYFKQLTETAESLLEKPQGTVWLNRLEKDLANIRTALDWAQERDPEAGVKLISSLGLFWWARGYVQEMETRINQLLTQTTSLDPNIRAKGLYQQGNFYHMLWQQEEAERVLQESLILYRELGDESGVGNVLRLLGDALYKRGKPKQGLLLMEESLARLRAIDDKKGIASILMFLSYHVDSDNGEQRWAYLKESESLYRELDFSAGIALILRNLGQLATLQGDFKLARAYLEEGLSLAKSLDIREIAHLLTDMGVLYFRLGDLALAQTTLEEAALEFKNPRTPWRQAKMWPVLHLGYVHLRRGNLWQAKQNFHQSLHWFKKWNDVPAICYSLEGLASFAVQREQAEKAARLFAWADAIRETISNSRPSIEQADVDQNIGRILEMIDDEAYATAYAEGQAMTMEQAIAYAIEEED